jgi:hypothetical protein
LVDARIIAALGTGKAEAHEGVHAAFAVEHAINRQAQPLDVETAVGRAVVLGREERDLRIPVGGYRAADGKRSATVVVGYAAVIQP